MVNRDWLPGYSKDLGVVEKTLDVYWMRSGN